MIYPFKVLSLVLALAAGSMLMTGCGGGDDVPLAKVPTSSELPKLSDGPVMSRVQRDRVSPEIPR